METVIITSQLLILARAVVALVVVWILLRVADRRASFNFSEWLNHAKDETPVAVGIYLGARVIAACVLVGLLFS